ncbi:hypothetical protein JOB18_030363 [Solea senegalensis]|uniref:Uncharacterized protein n=1 Tax=Solea senegalensis TaxID=28829 RepID=A0AAV6Q2X4_SOLSE|nr:hypothetical protein JOB18_030363 [Solea senegalensis]
MLDDVRGSIISSDMFPSDHNPAFGHMKQPGGDNTEVKRLLHVERAPLTVLEVERNTQEMKNIQHLMEPGRVGQS